MGVRIMALLAAASILAAGCGEDDEDEPAVATFRVVDEEFKVELASPELVEHVQALLDGETMENIPIGTVVRDDPGVNEPWSWHIDPATLQFAQATIEVCDGKPSFVEDETITSDQYCPWAAEAVSIEGD